MNEFIVLRISLIRDARTKSDANRKQNTERKNADASELKHLNICNFGCLVTGE